MQMRRRVRVLRRMHMPRRVQMRRRLQTQSRQTPKAPCPTRKFADRSRRLPKGARPPRHDGVPFPARSEAPRQDAASLCDARHRNEIGGDPLLLLKFSCSQSRVAQWQSIRLLIERLLVRVQPREPRTGVRLSGFASVSHNTQIRPLSRRRSRARTKAPGARPGANAVGRLRGRDLGSRRIPHDC